MLLTQTLCPYGDFRDYIMYTEVRIHVWSDENSPVLILIQTVLYDLFKRMLGSGPVYAALGNHDSYNQFVSPRFWIH